MVRRLPVLQNQDTDDAIAARRPRGHWVAIGAGFVVTMFLPLSFIGAWLGARLGRSTVSVGSRVVLGTVPVALCFLAACVAAGALVGRFGGRARGRESALAGALGAAAVWSLALFGGALSPWIVALGALVALAPLGAGAAFVGARMARHKRV